MFGFGKKRNSGVGRSDGPSWGRGGIEGINGDVYTFTGDGVAINFGYRPGGNDGSLSLIYDPRIFDRFEDDLLLGSNVGRVACLFAEEAAHDARPQWERL